MSKPSTKFKVVFNDSQILVKSKLSKTDNINQKELDVFNSKFIRGLMRPKISGNRKIEYLAPGNVKLSAHLKSGLTKNDFYIIFAQFVECLKKVEWNGFNFNNLILDTDLVFYNQVTKEVQFIYQPIENPTNTNNIYLFIYELANQTVLSGGEGRGFLEHLVNVISNQPTLSTKMLETYIIKFYPQIYKQIKRAKPGESQSLSQSGRTYFDKKYDETGGNSFKKDIIEDKKIEEFNDDFDEDTGLLLEDDEDTGLLEEEDTGLLEDDDIETSLLDENEGTTLIENNEPVYPYLIRLNTFEKILINKPAFRIGKEKSYVDYFVMSNNAVSRIHADIITRNGRFYIKDNNSTNHTFVNGTMIVSGQDAELFDGDAVMLANEPFEFHIN